MWGCGGSQEGNPESGGASTPKQSTLWILTEAERSPQMHLKLGFQHHRPTILQYKLNKQKTKTKKPAASAGVACNVISFATLVGFV